MNHLIDTLAAPLFVSWQITRDCDLACLHCCTASAPGRRLPDELDADAATRLARDIVRERVPYVMLCGGEPLVSPHFFMLVDALGGRGIQLKIESNGQRLDAAIARRLADAPVRSVQISLDAATQRTYARQRPGASLAKAHAACSAVRQAGLPLEVTFAPTRFNIHELDAVIETARALGAFRFNTGRLMRIGTAARLWERIEPSALQYRVFREALERQSAECADGDMEICYAPFSIEEGLRMALRSPPASLLVLPNGLVKVAAALPLICGDLRRESMAQVWDSYRRAWHAESTLAAVRRAIDDEAAHAQANDWQSALLEDR